MSCSWQLPHPRPPFFPRASPLLPPACSIYDAILPQIYAAMIGVVVTKGRLPEAAWYSAAEASLTAIYALHPAPEHLSAAMLRCLARRAFAPAPADGGDADGAPADGGDADGAPAEQADEAEGEEAQHEAMQEGDESQVVDGAAAGEEAGEGEESAGPAASEQTQQGVSQGQAGEAAQSQPRSMHFVEDLCRFFFALGHVALQHLVGGDVGAAPRRGGCRLPLLPLQAAWCLQPGCPLLCGNRRCSLSAPPRLCGACAWSVRSAPLRSALSAWRLAARLVGGWLGWGGVGAPGCGSAGVGGRARWDVPAFWEWPPTASVTGGNLISWVYLQHPPSAPS